MRISLIDTWCPNCGTQVLTLDSYKILTPKFLYRLLVTVGCRFQGKILPDTFEIESPNFMHRLVVGFEYAFRCQNVYCVCIVAHRWLLVIDL